MPQQDVEHNTTGNIHTIYNENIQIQADQSTPFIYIFMQRNSKIIIPFWAQTLIRHEHTNEAATTKDVR